MIMLYGKMNGNGVESLAKKMDILIKLTAIGALRDKNFREQVRILDSIGLKPSEIGELLGKTANNVRVTLYDIRKSGGANNGK